MPTGFTSSRLAVLRAAGAGRLEGADDRFVICRTHAIDEDVSEEAAGALADGQIELSRSFSAGLLGRDRYVLTDRGRATLDAALPRGGDPASG
jgi:hypothetical protein